MFWPSQQQTKLCEAKYVWTNLIIVIISQYIHVSSHYIVYFQLRQCYMSIIISKKLGKIIRCLQLKSLPSVWSLASVLTAYDSYNCPADLAAKGLIYWVFCLRNPSASSAQHAGGLGRGGEYREELGLPPWIIQHPDLSRTSVFRLWLWFCEGPWNREKAVHEQRTWVWDLVAPPL